MVDPNRWTSVALRVFSPIIPVSEITTLMGPATDTKEKGQAYSKLSKNLRTESVWILESPDEVEDCVRTRLAWIVSYAESRRERLRKIQESCQVDVVLGFASEKGQACVVLPDELLGRLGHLRLALVLDLYPPT